MTEFRKHDRVRIVDAGPGGRDQAGPGMLGDVRVVQGLVSGQRLTLFGEDGLWRHDRFELVEHAVGHDKDGEPLYDGDTVTVQGTGTRETMVMARPVAEDQVPLAADGRAHFSNVTLVRHRWETEQRPDALATALLHLSSAWAAHQEKQREQMAKVAEALAVVLDAATAPTGPALPTEPGSIVGPNNGTDRSEAVLMGGRWYFTGGAVPMEVDPSQWPGGFRIKRDASKENPK